jgi:hypothetical protein
MKYLAIKNWDEAQGELDQNLSIRYASGVMTNIKRDFDDRKADV